MSYLLQDPTTVLLVGEADIVPDDVRGAVLSGTATAVEDVPTVGKSQEALAEPNEVGCILLIAPGEDWTTGAACDALHEEAPDLPVIAYVDRTDESVATELTSRTHCRYLPRDASPTAVQNAVDDALDTYGRRRREAAEGSLFRTLLHESEVPIFAKDDEGRHLYKSGLASDESRSDVIGKTDVEIANPDAMGSARSTYEDDMTILETGEGIFRQEEHTGGENDEHWSLVTKVPWRDEDGDIQGLVGVAYDITWWKGRERQLRAQQRRVDQFASYLRHDMRTPLQVAYGAIELAREGDDDALDTIERAHKRMVEVVEDLSGLSGGDPSSHFADEAYDAVGLGIKSIYPVSIVEDLWELHGPPEATLSLELPADTVAIAQSGSVRLLIENLLKNAIEHAGPDVTVRVGMTDDRGFFIEDDGPGMPADLATAISEHDVESTGDASGTGLLIVIDAIQELGWEIRATDAGDSGDPDQGTESESRENHRSLDVSGEPSEREVHQSGGSGGARIEIGNCNLITDMPTDASLADSVDISANTDVGSVHVPGAASYDADSDQWQVTGAGRDIYGNINEFHFVYGTARAPVRIEGRVDKLDGVHEFSKAGLTIRGGLDEDAPFGYVGASESHGSEVNWRLSTDGNTTSDQFEERPLAFQWYRIDYVDDEMTCYLSENGEEWHPISQRSIDLGDEVLVGMLVCSHDAERSTEATFRDVCAWELDPL